MKNQSVTVESVIREVVGLQALIAHGRYSQMTPHDASVVALDDLLAALGHQRLSESTAAPLDVARLARALEANDPDDDGNLTGDPVDYFGRKAKHLAALYRTVSMDTSSERTPTLPPPDLSLIDVLTERAYPERPVVMRLSGEAGNKPPPPPPPDKG